MVLQVVGGSVKWIGGLIPVLLVIVGIMIVIDHHNVLDVVGVFDLVTWVIVLNIGSEMGKEIYSKFLYSPFLGTNTTN